MKCDHICKECGKHEQGSWMDSCAKDLTTQQLCFSCAFWYELVSKKNLKNSVRIEGAHYFVCKDIANNRWAGFGGRRFKIKFHDGREVTTNNLWCQGKIPDRFKERLPNNAEFV